MLLLSIFGFALLYHLAGAQAPVNLSASSTQPRQGLTTPKRLLPQECRRTDICVLTLQGLLECNSTTIDIHSRLETILFQQCLCKRDDTPVARGWNDTFAACLECFYDNRWVRDPYYAEVAQESFRNFCNHSFPNITRFDQIPMVELVAGIPPSARGRPDGPTIRERTTHPDGRVTFEPRPSSDGTDGPETSSEANTTTAASTSTDSIMSTTRTTAAPSPTASEDAQGDAAHGSLPAAWVVGTSLLGLIGSWMLVVLGVDLV